MEPKAGGSNPGLWTDFKIWNENTEIPNTTLSLSLPQNIKKTLTLKKIIKNIVASIVHS